MIPAGFRPFRGVRSSNDKRQDYARGRERIRLFEGHELPGIRLPFLSLSDLPSFNPLSERESPEVTMNSSRADPLHKCAPNGESKGHFIYNVWHPELVVFPTGTESRTDAAFLVAPGGGNEHLDWDTEGLSIAYWLNRQGITAFVLKYRVPDPSNLLDVIDAQRAMSIVRHIAPRYGVNPRRVGFWGSSTGGHMGIKLTFSKKRSYTAFDDADTQPWKPDFLVLLYPMIPDGLPVIYKDPRMPPTVMGYAQDDPCSYAHRSTSFLRHAYTAWSDNDELYVFQMYAAGGHGWSDCAYYPYLEDMAAEVCTFKWYFVRPWLQRVLRQLLPYDELPEDYPKIQGVGDTGEFGPEASGIAAAFELLA